MVGEDSIIHKKVRSWLNERDRDKEGGWGKRGEGGKEEGEERESGEKNYLIFFILVSLFNISRTKLEGPESRDLEQFCRGKQEEKVGKANPPGPRNSEKQKEDKRRKTALCPRLSARAQMMFFKI